MAAAGAAARWTARKELLWSPISVSVHVVFAQGVITHMVKTLYPRREMSSPGPLAARAPLRPPLANPLESGGPPHSFRTASAPRLRSRAAPAAAVGVCAVGLLQVCN